MPFPNIPFSDMTLRSVNPTRITQVINGVEQRSAVGAQYFQLTANFSNLSKANQRALMAHIDEMRGPLTAFDITLPDYIGDSTGAWTSTITLAANASTGANSVSVTSAASDGVVILKAGDLIRFASHNKVYMVKSDVTAVTGNETITLTQPLRAAVTNGTTVTHQNVNMSVRYSQDIGEFRVDPSEYASFTLEFTEVLS